MTSCAGFDHNYPKIGGKVVPGQRCYCGQRTWGAGLPAAARAATTSATVVPLGTGKAAKKPLAMGQEDAVKSVHAENIRTSSANPVVSQKKVRSTMATLSLIGRKKNGAYRYSLPGVGTVVFKPAFFRGMENPPTSLVLEGVAEADPEKVKAEQERAAKRAERAANKEKNAAERAAKNAAREERKAKQAESRNKRIADLEAKLAKQRELAEKDAAEKAAKDAAGTTSATTETAAEGSTSDAPATDSPFA